MHKGVRGFSHLPASREHLRNWEGSAPGLATGVSSRRWSDAFWFSREWPASVAGVDGVARLD